MKLRMISRLFQFLCLAGAVFGRTEPDLSLWKDLTEALWVGRISFPCIDPSGIEQGTSSAAGADAGIFSPDSFQDVGYAHVRIPSSESLAVLQPEDQPEVTDFPNAQTGRIHEGGHGFDFDVRDGLNKGPDFFLGRDVREVSVKLPHGELGWIPGLMENIHREEADLRDSTVDGAVR